MRTVTVPVTRTWTQRRQAGPRAPRAPVPSHGMPAGPDGNGSRGAARWGRPLAGGAPQAAATRANLRVETLSSLVRQCQGPKSKTEFSGSGPGPTICRGTVTRTDRAPLVPVGLCAAAGSQSPPTGLPPANRPSYCAWMPDHHLDKTQKYLMYDIYSAYVITYYTITHIYTKKRKKSLNVATPTRKAGA